MNIIDIIIVSILAISVIFGAYRGFIDTVGSFIGTIVSIASGLIFAPKLAVSLGSSPEVSRIFSNITDSIARVGDIDLASERVVNMSQDLIDKVIKSVGLPEAINKVLESNFKNGVYKVDGLETVNDYVSSTLVSICINVLCFLAVFVISLLIIKIILSIVHHVFSMPVLRQLDGLAGAFVGVFRGAVIIYVIMIAMPIIKTAFPKGELDLLLNKSQLMPYFENLTLFLKVALFKT